LRVGDLTEEVVLIRKQHALLGEVGQPFPEVIGAPRVELLDEQHVNQLVDQDPLGFKSLLARFDHLENNPFELKLIGRGNDEDLGENLEVLGYYNGHEGVVELGQGLEEVEELVGNVEVLQDQRVRLETVVEIKAIGEEITYHYEPLQQKPLAVHVAGVVLPNFEI
jgi:hypothetical protein